MLFLRPARELVCDAMSHIGPPMWDLARLSKWAALQVIAGTWSQRKRSTDLTDRDAFGSVRVSD
jgi:hypothetical protein